MPQATSHADDKQKKPIKINVITDQKSKQGIRIAIDKLAALYPRISSSISQRARTRIVVLVPVLLVVLIFFFVIKPIFIGNSATTNESKLSKQNDPTSTQPQYKTITPDGNSIDQYGGWTRVSPSDKNPVFAFSINIGNVKIIVSEQPLPADFINDADVQTEQLAIGYKANEKISFEGNTAYIGTSANGPQSVIFYRDDLLILIKSSSKIPNDKWAEFIKNLR